MACRNFSLRSALRSSFDMELKSVFESDSKPGPVVLVEADEDCGILSGSPCPVPVAFSNAFSRSKPLGEFAFFDSIRFPIGSRLAVTGAR